MENSLRDRYQVLVKDLVDRILAGKQIISREYIYRVLSEEIVVGTSEIIEGCLNEQIDLVQQEIASQSSEVKQAKLGHKLKAFQTIEGVLGQWQQDRQASELVTQIVDRVIRTESGERLNYLFQALDRNQAQPLTVEQIRSIGELLKLTVDRDSNLVEPEQIQDLAMGIDRGLKSLVALEPHLVSWIYEGNQQIGFGSPSENSPWTLWAKQINHPFIQQLFHAIADGGSIAEWIEQRSDGSADNLVQLALVLQGLQSGLVTWFDRQMYDRVWGTKMAFSTLMTFAILWCELANGIGQATSINSHRRQSLSKACFQVSLQILRIAAQRTNFPLYGGIFASFSGETLRDTLAYFDLPLKQVEGTQEKGRILTILGYSQQTLGQVERAIRLHQEALSIAQQANDHPCAIANLNHLSRIYLRQKDYAQSSNYSQRALISARQIGDRLGEANALTNYGYSEVLSAHANEQMDPDIYEQNISYLEQGLKIAEQLEDKQSLALGHYSLGLAYLVLDRVTEAIAAFQQGVRMAQAVGDLYLQGLNLSYLAEAYYSQEKYQTAVYYACLGMYQLYQINAPEWRQSAGLMMVIQGQMGVEEFQELVNSYRDRFLPIIGLDGFDYLPTLWNRLEP
jgi:tetratricopeptide (TPR) repeat protein